MRLEGKKAVVTGGGRGVGRAISLAFGREGADVIINYVRNDEAAKEAVSKLREMGRDGLAVKANVAVKEDAERLIGTCVDRFGRIDILVNNAGVSKPAMLHKMTEQQWDEVVDIHLKGAFLCTQAASRHFVEQNYGKIINVTSVAGIVGTTGQINYAAAKGGLISFTKSCTRELARYNVTANVISLGIVLTDMTKKLQEDPKLREIYLRRILLNRYAEPEDIAPAFVFLASDESNYITGQLLCVDGGYGLT
ncbi:MAG: 3-oxoacyl-ACP reductase FabG [Syntrophobacterales bacterium]|nr:MAG: 3-oxoacyl-ACP reductase FabG [Syntrophobacterales bacterium]